MIIGLGHQARVGKDTVADHLVAEYGFEKFHFAGALKDAAATIFGLSYEQMYGSMKEVIDPYWEETPRNIMQKFGTECLRKGYRDDVWIKALGRKLASFGPDRHAVICDVRFANEAEAVQSWGGMLWKVTRASRPDISTTGHSSETALSSYADWDEVIHNDGTLTDLWTHVDMLISEVAG